MGSILITGGSGLVGSALTMLLRRKNYEVRHLSRTPRTGNNARAFFWDPSAREMDSEALIGVDRIIHLAGSPVAEKRWSERRKKEIIDSRVGSAKFLLDQVEKSGIRLKSFIAASAIGYYGNRGDELLTEESKSGEGFLPESCRLWEASSRAFKAATPNVSILRFGIILSKKGGALPKMTMTSPLGLNAYFGNGEQYYSWIHMDDVLNILLFLLENPSLSGTYNVVAPHPVTNKDFVRAIRKAYKRPSIALPVPRIALQAMLGEMSAVVLDSALVSSHKIEAAGYTFRFPDVDGALQNILS